MDFKIIGYKTAEYDQMVALRTKILRKPLGISFSEEDLERDKNDLLLAAYFPGSDQMVGCCILTPISEVTIQLRQMAVDDFYQGKGLGSELLQYSEQVATERNFEYLYLHARKVAVDFYRKHGYTIEGDQFTEVGIPHYEMIKRLK
ncbi:putative GNAT family N-acyltransferase [Dysgonomonas sp. PFB1-18]|uniref:GNAT family N-acetyltransferase n=1 Tax=unclassified Dysgonomonas TaxID=2630389 RepID=UPI0024731D7E|nr:MULTISPECIES: GNAT family N-acetyltransferase [unclassified Dysgonomonas]MDH6307866.1 putative GNAT family N-acyltransferase [Dysgonomonas sp. PF1-14]MDH6337784.1 putative GNAT family N-acyltransferase [Dysgonomonas sp. PF1-16]MDH6379008.1 putative GNAT family N-acyltransferase [Dysgonomonas sp. PFB1-18]MDH6396643.1 putative GNAT family N-acyltransferase [Dysgonomonas sp. PF1-23]